jgi:hypothetical protein
MDAFHCTAKDLLDPAVDGRSKWLRLAGDADDPQTWHHVDVIHDRKLEGDVFVLTVSFHDGTLDVIFNDDDPVEFAIIRPPGVEHSG